MLRSYFPLPTPKTLTKNIGSFNDIGSEAEAAEICKTVFSYGVNSNSKFCGVIYDEVHILPSVRLRGGHILG